MNSLIQKHQKGHELKIKSVEKFKKGVFDQFLKHFVKSIEEEGQSVGKKKIYEKEISENFHNII